MENLRKKVLAVSSGGGHWVQLLRLCPAFVGCDVAYVTVQASYRSQVEGARFYAVTDATRWSRWDLIRMCVEIVWIVVKERPNVIISTGAAPGVVALKIGKMLGARTIWVDSIANVERMSLSGLRVKTCADLWLSQWPEVSKAVGSAYKGTVL
jgi:UDP-N-acetylglucosamine:LPS N-acetylglucosamine transferase